MRRVVGVGPYPKQDGIPHPPLPASALPLLRVESHTKNRLPVRPGEWGGTLSKK